jgi:hypothetical protein
MNHSSAFSGQNKRSQTIAEPSWAEELVPEPVLSSAPFPNLQAKSQQASLLPDQDRARTQFAAFFERAVNGELARLQIRTGTLAGESIPIATPTLTLGATPASQAGSLPGAGQLVLPDDSTISAQHARLFWEGSILKIEDLNSTNGTYLNAVRLTPGRHLLKPGDEIRIGRTMLVVSSA